MASLIILFQYSSEAAQHAISTPCLSADLKLQLEAVQLAERWLEDGAERAEAMDLGNSAPPTSQDTADDVQAADELDLHCNLLCNKLMVSF